MHKTKWHLCGALILAAIVVDTTPSNAADVPSVAGVNLEDKRPEARKKKSRSSVMSPSVILGDDTLKPSGLVRFQEAVSKSRGKGDPFTMVVDDFAVIDYFPKRMSGLSGIGGLTAVIVEQMIDSRTDWKMVEQLGLPPNTDAIICLFSGSIDGKPATVAAFSSYKISAMAMSVRGSKPFKEAVDDAIDKAAKDALKN